jgi:hypothetical protein
VNLEQFVENLLSQVKLPIDEDPSTVFLWIDRELDKYKAAGGTVNDSFKKKVLKKGLAAEVLDSSVFSSSDFWFSCRGYLKMAS